jgi:hypothetical protein
MNEDQKVLMKSVKKSLEYLLDSGNSIGAPANILVMYRFKLSQLALNFPNQETLALALDLMDKIYNAQIKKNFYWIDDIERLTVTSLRFTDLSAVYKNDDEYPLKIIK